MASLLFPNSVVAHFPEEIYKTSGSSVVLPHLLSAVDQDKLTTVQFLRGGLVRLTFKDSTSCDNLVTHGLVYGDVQVRVFRADNRVRSVFVRDLPSEVPDDDVRGFFGSFGEVLSVRRGTFADFPSIHNGNRIVEVALMQDVPYFVSISGFNCRIWYARQPAHCVICRESGHRAPSCPLSGLCRRCRQPGHMARECKQAWGDFHPSTETLAVTEDDNSPDYAPPSTEDASEESEGECEMASGDEEVAAQAVAPLPSRSTVSVSCASVPPVQVSASASVPPVSVSTAASMSPDVHIVSSVCAPRPTVSTALQSPMVQVSSPISTPGSIASASPVSLPARFPEKLAKFVQTRVSSYVSALPHSLLNYSDSAINVLARGIIEEHDIGDVRAFDCTVAYLRYYRKKLEQRAKKS